MPKVTGEVIPLSELEKTFITIPITIGAVTTGYGLYFTNAPVAYDYPYCIQVQEEYTTYHSDYTGIEGRIVLIPVERAYEYQLPRYISGPYRYYRVTKGEQDNEGFLEDLVVDILLRRLRKLTDYPGVEEPAPKTD